MLGILTPSLQNDQSKRIVLLKRIRMIHSLDLVFQLSFDHPIIFGHGIDTPDILRKISAPLDADKTLHDTSTKNISCFGWSSDAGRIAKRFVQARDRGRLEAERSGITLVLGVATIRDRPQPTKRRLSRMMRG